MANFLDMLGGSDGYGLIPTALGFVGASQAQKETNAQNIALAREQMAFQERMSSTAYQRARVDLEKAGFNPILAATHGGASSPSGSLAQVSNPVSAGMSSAGQAANSMAALQQVRQSQAQIDQMNAQTAKIKSETMDVAVNTAARMANIEVARAQGLKTLEEVPGVRASSARNLQLLDEERYPGSYPDSAFAADVRARKAAAKLKELDIPKGEAEVKFWQDTGPMSQYLKLFMTLLNSAGSASRFVK